MFMTSRPTFGRSRATG